MSGTLDIKALRTHETLHPTKPFPLTITDPVIVFPNAAPTVDLTGTIPGAPAVFPTSPADGSMISVLVDPGGVMWQFRYVAVLAGSNPWIFIGGAPLTAVILTTETTVSTTFVDLATVGPSITVPRSGSYLIGTDCGIANNTATDGGAAAPTSTTLGAANPINGVSVFSPAANNVMRVAAWMEPAALGVGETLKLQYEVRTGGTASFSTRRISLLPVAVS